MRRQRQRVRGAVSWLLLLVVLGCRTPAAHLAGCHPGSTPRKCALARQLLADSVVETAQHPVETAVSVLRTPPALLRTFGQEFVIKPTALHRTAQAADLPPGPPLDPVDFEQELRQETGTDLEPAAVRLYPDGDGALAALLEVIEQAQQQIDVLMFLWQSDPVGDRIADRLAARAVEGLRVRVLVDGGGNLVHGEGRTAQEVNRAVCRLARAPGVELLRTRNPFGRFDHRKLVVADGGRVWSGGRNFLWEGFFAQRDLSFTLEGPLACRLAEKFEHFWREQGGRPGCHLPCPPPPAQPDGLARLVETAPGCRTFAASVYRALDHAGHHVFLENLFVSDSCVVAKLVRAQRRGADVRVLLTIEGNSEVMNRAGRVAANRLLAAGVRVYLHPGMLHTKAAVVDGCWGYVGTGNFDALSLRQDRELGLAVSSGPLLCRLEEVLATGHRPEWELKEPLPVTARDHTAAFLAALFL